MDKTYTLEEIRRALGVPEHETDERLLSYSMSRDDFSRVHEWRRYLSVGERSWKQLSPLERLIAFAMAKHEAMMEVWD